MKRIIYKLAVSAALLSACVTAVAQPKTVRPVNIKGEGVLDQNARVAISTNVADYVYLLTPNADLQVAIGRQVTLQGGFKYNNWSWNYATETEMKNRQQTYWFGARYWFWYTYSGWYASLAAQWQEYDRGGLFRKDAEAGQAYGLVASGGYAMQINRWFNIDFGLGIWGGTTAYTLYACPYCGKKLEEGRKFFVLPNEVRLALQFIF